jgi:transposase
VYVEGISEREASKRFGIARKTVHKMLGYSAPPGYQRKQPVKRPKLEAFSGVIDQILEADRQQIRKQRHTNKRIFERLRQEHGYTGGYTVVKDYVREQKVQQKEMVRSAVAPARACAGGFRRSRYRTQWASGENAFLRDGSAAQRCGFRDGVSGRDE